MSSIVSSTLSCQAARGDRASAREQTLQQAEKLSDAMIEQKGLLNHA